jgi:tetratricopeptide (TPR) repeat protein
LRIKLHLKEGNFNDAFSAAYGIIKPGPAGIQGTAPVNSQSIRLNDEIEYEAATALFYMGKYDSSLYYLKKIVSNPSSDAANEAIQLMNTISDNRGNPAALGEFASASAMEESGRSSEAAAALEKLLSTYPNAPLADHARFNLASDYCRMGNVAEALRNYSTLAEDSTGVFADRAEFRIGRIYQESLHQNQQAVTEYESFLVRFPNSIYQNRVREILRSLLGENS